MNDMNGINKNVFYVFRLKVFFDCYSLLTSLKFNCFIFQSFFHILAVDAAAVASTISFMFVNSTAGYLMLPYLGWLGVVSFLSYNVWQFNKDDITSA